MSNKTRRQPIGKKGFAYRYPNFFILTSVTVSMCILFSKPLYDIFFAEPPVQEMRISRKI